MYYSIIIEYDVVDEIFVARIPELRGCMAHGTTREEAMAQVYEAMELQLEVMEEKGQIIPEPAYHRMQMAA
jgi:predicted RNase H-like HicB family nuclease